MQICQALATRNQEASDRTGRCSSAVNVSTLPVQMELSDSILPLRAAWTSIQPDDNRFLQFEYLRLLEENPPRNTRPVYLVLRSAKGACIGLVFGQIATFDGRENLRSDAGGSRFVRTLRGFFAKRVKIQVLFIGNLLLTGQHGFHFTENNSESAKLLDQAVHFLMDAFPVNGVFVKDIETHNQTLRRQLVKASYTECSFLPNMVLDILPEWADFDDYTAALSSKYRVRQRRAAKHLQGLEQRRLSYSEIEGHLSRINALYREVMESADFNLQELHPNYFLSLANQMGEDFSLYAYFDNEQLIGFYTLIRNHKEAEAHFIGFDRAYNQSHQLYLNMLYDMIRQSIDLGSERLIFARTAAEIKSSVGAVPHQLFCHIRARNRVSNQLVEPVLNLLRNDTNPWVQRHPFK